MNAQRNTYTLLPDVPGTYHDRPNVEEMQEEYLIERIGNVMYAVLQEATDEHERTKP